MFLLSASSLHAFNFDTVVPFSGSSVPAGTFYQQLPFVQQDISLLVGFSAIVPGRKTEELDTDLKLGLRTELPLLGMSDIYFTFDNHGGVIREGHKKKKGHDCASKVKHEEYGVGDCLKEMHDLDEDGNVSHYDVKFASRIVRNVPSSDLVVLEGMYHEHVIRDEIEVNEVAPVVAMAGKAALAGGAWAAGEAAAKKVVKKKDDKQSETVEGYQRNPEIGQRKKWKE